MRSELFKMRYFPYMDEGIVIARVFYLGYVFGTCAGNTGNTFLGIYTKFVEACKRRWV